MKSNGQIAYELDCQRRPIYHDGTPRKAWDDLPAFARATWEHNPEARNVPSDGAATRDDKS